MINSIALSGLRENVILTGIILTTDDISGYVRGDTWYQGDWHGLMVMHAVDPLPLVWQREA